VISRIKGTLLRRDPGLVEVMTPGGVAYEVQIPLMVFERLPDQGHDIELRTWQVVREDAVELFGFMDATERDLFGRLLSASGVGPRLALSVLSSLPPDRVVRAILDKDIATLRRIPGLGTKKAERLVLELADRVTDLAVASVAATGTGRGASEAVKALVALGYSSADAAAAVRRTMDDNGALEPIDLIKAALAAMKK
jgi:holliday junction DNA helicase RuvA